MPHSSREPATRRSCFLFQKVAGFEAANFDLHWLVLTDRRHRDEKGGRCLLENQTHNFVGCRAGEQKAKHRLKNFRRSK